MTFVISLYRHKAPVLYTTGQVKSYTRFVSRKQSFTTQQPLLTLKTLLKIWLVPPAINIVAILIGVLLLRTFLKTGVTLILLSVLSLYLLSTPTISTRLGHSLEAHRAVQIENLPKHENLYIVVVGSAHHVNAEEFGGPSPNVSGLVRLHYAANLHRLTDLPILLTGGPIKGHPASHAEVLAKTLKQVYQIEAHRLENKSQTTLENALFSAEILAAEGIKKIILVTQSYHMKRSIMLFEHAGFEVIPAPTQLSDRYELSNWRFWMPDTESLHLSSRVIYEYIGIFWYKLILDISPETNDAVDGKPAPAL